METIKAKTKLEALKIAGYKNIYWKGQKPYACSYGIYTSHVYAIKMAKGEFYISQERVN
jgi:hypothetical protein